MYRYKKIYFFITIVINRNNSFELKRCFINRITIEMVDSLNIMYIIYY